MFLSSQMEKLKQRKIHCVCVINGSEKRKGKEGYQDNIWLKRVREQRAVKSLAERLVMILMCTYPFTCTEMAHLELKSLVPAFLTD